MNLTDKKKRWNTIPNTEKRYCPACRSLNTGAALNAQKETVEEYKQYGETKYKTHKWNIGRCSCLDCNTYWNEYHDKTEDRTFIADVE